MSDTPPTRAPWMEDATVQAARDAMNAARRAWRVEFNTDASVSNNTLAEIESTIDALCTAVERATLAAQEARIATLEAERARLENDVTGTMDVIRSTLGTYAPNPRAALNAANDLHGRVMRAVHLRGSAAARAVPPTTPETRDA